MVKEIALLPEVPKCLTNFDPTKFRPDWKASGRRWRVDKASKCLDEVGEALYSKGVVRMSLMSAVDDSRKVCHIVVGSQQLIGLSFLISLNNVLYCFGTSFSFLTCSRILIVASTYSFLPRFCLKYFIVFTRVTFEKSSSINWFSFSLSDFSGRRARSEQLVPSTNFPANHESLKMLMQNRQKC